MLHLMDGKDWRDSRVTDLERLCDNCVNSIDCIKETDVTSVTSPIGLWTAARKPIVSNLGSAILKISGACWEK